MVKIKYPQDERKITFCEALIEAKKQGAFEYRITKFGQSVECHHGIFYVNDLETEQMPIAWILSEDWTLFIKAKRSDDVPV